jgi:hypothetical protein
LCGSPCLDLKPTIKRVPWALLKDGRVEIENKEIERHKAIVGGVQRGKHCQNLLRWAPPPLECSSSPSVTTPY